ncbi:hypothetical protein ACIQM0_31760 [Streptomyces sp. NPDC091387]|uniref:hypothetical protein n=1 Tax=Streptomyces sp. NPDC091387 TaxID=3365998 RepID=UPI003816DC70
MQNLMMPGLAGLGGNHTYTAVEGSATGYSQDRGNAQGAAPGPRLDKLISSRSSYRHVRTQWVTGRPKCKFSPYACEIRDGAGGTNLAEGKAATTSPSTEPTPTAGRRSASAAAPPSIR